MMLDEFYFFKNPNPKANEFPYYKASFEDGAWILRNKDGKVLSLQFPNYPQIFDDHIQHLHNAYHYAGCSDFVYSWLRIVAGYYVAFLWNKSYKEYVENNFSNIRFLNGKQTKAADRHADSVVEDFWKSLL